MILRVSFRILEWLKVEKLSDNPVQPLTQHVFVDVVLILRENKWNFMFSSIPCAAQPCGIQHFHTSLDK